VGRQAPTRGGRGDVDRRRGLARVERSTP
jgi:hypothetical protein